MLIKRRMFLVGALCTPALLLSNRGTRAHKMFEGIPIGEVPGDYGYKHALYHPSYQKLFGKHCACGDGDCRVSDWRGTILGSPKGYDVFVDRDWWALPKEAWVPEDPSLVPRDLWRERAHVCAYDYGAFPLISCALINVTQV